MNLSARLRNAFSIDLRSLALFRVLASLAVIANVLIILPDLGAWVTDDALNTRTDAISRLTPHHLSLYYASGAVWYSGLLLAATLVAAAAMLIGWHTRVATVATWVLMASLTNRIPILTSAADTQITVMLFWSMFLPLGARFSVDSALATVPRQRADGYFSIATAALLLQVAYLYFFGALLKTGTNWHETYDAVYYAISSVEIVTPFAAYLASLQSLLRPLTVYVYYLEILAILFMFTPYLLAQARLFIVLQLVLMHIGFAVFLSIALFPLISIAGLMVFVPSLLWNKALPWWNRRAPRRNIDIYYDRDCGFCMKICLIFRELCLSPDTAIRPAQDDREIHSVLERENSWVVRTHDGQLLTKWSAVAYVWRRSPLLWWLGLLSLLPGLQRVGDLIYSGIASARPTLSRLSTKLLPYRANAHFHPQRATGIVLAFLMSLVFLWNVDNLRYERFSFYFPDQLRPIMWITRLHQRWDMFAPNSLALNRWLVVEGRSTDGSSVDLLFGRLGAPSHERPQHGFATFPNYRWRKFHSRFEIGTEGLRLGDFHCRRAPKLGFSDIDRVEITQYVQPVAAPGAEPNRIETRARHVHYCAGDKFETSHPPGQLSVGIENG